MLSVQVLTMLQTVIDLPKYGLIVGCSLLKALPEVAFLVYFGESSILMSTEEKCLNYKDRFGADYL